MVLLYYIPVFFCLVSCVSADNWDDFANNLATDLAPLITLFGEQITRQCMSELLFTLDNFIFALVPLGVLTAVVSAIRVCGNSTLRAIIGRAQEDPASSEKEILSCVSDSTAEIFTDSGVARITGNPRILEIVADESQALSGVINVRKLSEFVPKACTDKEMDAKLPNLSLNKGIRRRAPFWFHLAAAFGVFLQLSIIIYAALTVMYWPQAFLKDGSPVDSYAFPMFVLGTVLLTLGMFLCAVLVERRSKKFIIDLQDGNRVYWIQPGNQTAGDQKFPSFVGRTDKGISYIQSVRHDSPTTLLNLGREMELMLVVSLTMIGFVIQFVGIRGLHSSVSLAQLGATMVMTLVRTGLRAGRMQEGENMLKSKEQNIVSKGEHELDWLVFHLFNIRSFKISPSNCVHGPNSQLQVGPIIRASILTRNKLTKLVGSDWIETPVRRLAHNLGQATQELMRLINEWSRKEATYFDICIPIGVQRDGDMQEISGIWQTRLSLNDNVDSDFWGAIISLYVWSLKCQNHVLNEEIHGAFFRAFTIKDRSSHQARLLYRKWTNESSISQQNLPVASSFLYGCQTFGILQHRTTDPITDGTALVEVPSDVYMLAAQDIFSHVTHSILEKLDDIGWPTLVKGNDKDNYQLCNSRIESLAAIYENFGLGTRNEGLLCVLPVLANRSLLPEIPPSSYEVCQCMIYAKTSRERNELYLEYNELVTISEWLCSLADYGEIEYLLNEYGYICLAGLMPMPFGIEVEAIAVERLAAIMEADQKSLTSISSYVNSVASIPPLQWRKDFQSQISWLTLRLMQHQALYALDEKTTHKLNKFQEIIGTTFALRGAHEDPKTAALSEEALCDLWFGSNKQILSENLKKPKIVISWLLKNDYQTILDILLLRLTDICSSSWNYQAMIEIMRYFTIIGYKKAIFLLSRNIEKTALWDPTIERLAMDGDVQIIEALLEQTRRNAKQGARERTYLVAAGHKQLPLLRLMVQSGVDIDIQDNEMETALMKAATQNDTESIRFLITHGASLEIKNKDLDTALILGAESGYLDAVKILLEKGANVNAIGQEGRTALMAAVHRNSLETSRFLLERGADVHVRNSHGHTALDLARFANENGRMAEVCDLLERAGIRHLAS